VTQPFITALAMTINVSVHVQMADGHYVSAHFLAPSAGRDNPPADTAASGVLIPALTSSTVSPGLSVPIAQSV